MKKVESKEKKITHARTFKGVVASNKMKDTVVVVIERFVKHPRYGKYITLRKRVKASDVGNTCVIGDKVVIREVKPISKNKKFAVVK